MSFPILINKFFPESPWIKYLEISSFILTIFPFILHGTVANRVLTLIFLIKICVDKTIKFLLNRIFDSSEVMKRRIFSLFVLDLIVYLFLGYILVMQKDGYLFSILLIFHFPLSEKKSMNYLKIRSEIDMVALLKLRIKFGRYFYLF